MHERDAAEQLIKNICSICEQKRIIPTVIRVEVGILTTFTSKWITYYYDELKTDVPLLQDTSLEAKMQRVEIYCNTCRQESSLTDPFPVVCPLCSSTDVRVKSGNNLLLRSILTE